MVEGMKKVKPIKTAYCVWRAPLGTIAVLWTVHKGQPKIVRVLLYGAGVSAKQAIQALRMNSERNGCSEIDQVADQMEAFLGGANIRFSLNSILLDLCSDFQQKVLRAEYGIPRGNVSTYQLIARFIGNGARAVGAALATNPFPIIIPCHRALRSDRTLGGYQGGLTMKRALLEAEGIRFDKSGRVVGEDFFYSSTGAALTDLRPINLREKETHYAT